VPEGNRRIEIFPTDTDIGAPGCRLQFLKRCPERLFERSAFVGFQGLLRDKDRHELRFRQLEERQVRYRLREIIAAPRKIEFDRHAHLVTHVIDVALDRLGRDLDRFREFGAVGVPAGLDRVEDLLKPVKRRARAAPTTTLLIVSQGGVEFFQIVPASAAPTEDRMPSIKRRILKVTSNAS
jgi:hypothetical protein